jgi:hypothetical protein
MKRGYVLVWASVFLTLVLVAFGVGLWLGHSHVSYVIAPLIVVAWTWWSALQGVRQRRKAPGS